MKKLLLGSAAIAGLVFASAPAQAQLELTIGGHSKNYVGWLDQDTTASLEERNFDMIRETELHFNGESTLDNGLTFGFQVETEVDAEDDSNTIEESYIYMSGTWGRVNLGSEDGAAYLLQVSAPSADSNIDGIRQYVQPVNYTVAGIAGALGQAGAAVPGSTAVTDGFDYDQDFSGVDEKITYLSPNWNGLQLGASYTPESTISAGGTADASVNSVNGNAGFGDDDDADDIGDIYEIAVRYEGVMSNFGYAIGGGYTHADLEDDGATRDDDLQAWNVGLDVDAGPFGIGAVYTEAETGLVSGQEDIETFVVGVDYTTGPFKFGASYYNQEDETGVTSGELETDRYTGGVIYTAGPGLSFRGSISHIEHDLTGSDDVDATSVLGGVQINF